MATYLTVPEELQAVADRLAQWFEEKGYRVHQEKDRPDSPYLASFECRRRPTTLLVEVLEKVPSKERLQEWVAYCKSQASDTRYLVGLQLTSPQSVAALKVVKEFGVGILLVGGDFDVYEEHVAQDLTLSIGLPMLKKYQPKVREILGPAWDMVTRGDFIEGFESACVAFEGEVRRYLNRHIKSGRVQFVSAKGTSRIYTAAAIRRMTMGQLKDAFAQIVAPNHADSNIGKFLEELNQTRIQAAHLRRDERSARAVRRNGPALLWKIAVGIEECQQ